MNSYPNSLRGHLVALAAMALFGIISPIAKLLLADGPMTGMMLSTLRLVGPAICFLPLLLLLPRQRMQRRDLLPLTLMSLCGMALSTYSYTIGIGMTLPSHAGVLSTMPPMFVLILSVIFLKQSMNWTRALGIALATIGVLMLVFAGDVSGNAKHMLLGDALCLLTQLLLACYFVFFTGLIQRYHPFVLLTWLFGISSLLALPFVASDLANFPWEQMRPKDWSYTAILVLGSTFIPYVLITIAQRLLQPSLVACYNYVQPVVALGLSLAWGLEAMSWTKAAAIAFIVVGMLVITQLIRFKKGSTN